MAPGRVQMHAASAKAMRTINKYNIDVEEDRGVGFDAAKCAGAGVAPHANIRARSKRGRVEDDVADSARHNRGSMDRFGL